MAKPYFSPAKPPKMHQKEELTMERNELYEKYPCVHRDKDGACGMVAWICDCGFPDLCPQRELEAIADLHDHEHSGPVEE